MIKYTYWVIDDFGNDKKVSKSVFLYYLKEFGRTLMNESGKMFKQGEIEHELVANVYNPQGVLIAWRSAAENSTEQLLISLPETTRDDINEILTYLFSDEYKHWEESGKPSDHIYKTLLRVKKWLATIKSK